MDTVSKGRLGEAHIAAHFVSEGYDVYMPTFGNADFDMVVAKDGSLLRVEVKTTSYEKYPGRYEVQLRSTRHNTSTVTTHKFDGKRSDLLAIYIVPLSKVIIFNSIDYDGRNTVAVG